MAKKQKKGRLSYRPAMSISMMAVACILCAVLAGVFRMSGIRLWALLFGLPAVVLGALSLQMIKGSHGALSGKGIAYAGVVLGGLVAVTSIFGVAKKVSGTVGGSERDRKACRENLEYLGDALNRYRQEHGGKLPQALSELFPAYVTRAGVFHCPGDRDPEPKGIDYRSALVSYDYSPEKAAAGLASFLIMEDNSLDNHGGGGKNQLSLTPQGKYVLWQSSKVMR